MANKFFIAALLCACTTLAIPVSAQVHSEPITENRSADIDYSSMNKFMKTYSKVVNGRPKIYYQAVRDRAQPYLGSYVQYLAAQDVANLSSDAKLAYWLNFHNVLVIKAVAGDTKKTKLKNMRGTKEAPGEMWTRRRIGIAGTSMSIADIEQKIASNWHGNADVIYGLYQGVRGGPPINKISYTEANVNSELAKVAKAYINTKGVIRINNDTASVPLIYHWYKDAFFGATDKAVIDHMRSYAEPKLAAKLTKSSRLGTAKFSYKVDIIAVPNPTRPAPRTGGYGS